MIRCVFSPYLELYYLCMLTYDLSRDTFPLTTLKAIQTTFKAIQLIRVDIVLLRDIFLLMKNITHNVNTCRSLHNNYFPRWMEEPAY